jgi:hypothetical protein
LPRRNRDPTPVPRIFLQPEQDRTENSRLDLGRRRRRRRPQHSPTLGHGIFSQRSLGRSVRFGEKLRNAVAKVAVVAEEMTTAMAS